MRTLPALLLLLLLVTAPAPAAAQRALTANILTAEPGVPAPVAAIGDVAWIAGHWRGEGLGGLNEEVWTPPLAGTMMGVYRMVRDGAVSFYEILTLAPEGESLVLTLRHFHPDLRGWEERDETVRFPLVRLEEGAAWFDGMTFRRLDADTLEVFVALGRDGAAPREARFHYRRWAP